MYDRSKDSHGSPFGYSLATQLPLHDTRQAEWAGQRATRGFDNTEIWNLDVTIAKFVLPRLQAYRELHGRHNDAHAVEVDKMIAAFQMIVDGKHMNASNPEIDAGIEAFHNNYFALWV